MEAHPSVEAVRMWRQLIAGALARRDPLDDEETVEYLVGYLDPEASWEAVVTEMADSFPGALVRADEILGALVAFAEELAANRRLASADTLLSGLEVSLAAVRQEADRLADDRLTEALATLYRAVDTLTRQSAASGLSLVDRERLTARLGRCDPNGPQ